VPADDPGRAAGRTGRPPLTDRRKAATRLEIARVAVRLFTTKGVTATSAEEIAAAAGISTRTLWRYFPNKESCVAPLLTAGIEATARSLRDWPPGQGAAALADDLAHHTDGLLIDVRTLVALVRLTRTEPGLRAVWLQAHDSAEPVFAAALAQRAGLPGDSLPVRVRAAVVNSALRAAVEHYAWHTTPADAAGTAGEGLIEAVRTALLTAAEGLPP
jgi:AcrR family transcriptional regulator